MIILKYNLYKIKKEVKTAKAVSMENFPEITTSIGKYVEDFVNYIASAFSGFFDFIFFIASRSINGIDDFLEIGRASCRERVVLCGGTVAVMGQWREEN